MIMLGHRVLVRRIPLENLEKAEFEEKWNHIVCSKSGCEAGHRLGILRQLSFFC